MLRAARSHPWLCLESALSALAIAASLAGCSVVTPDAGAGSAPSKEPGKPFGQNACFRCTLQACSVSSNACGQEASCASWLNCVARCPTDESGVAATPSCVQRCGLPASAQVLFGCIQDFSTGTLVGCEAACEPP